MSIGVSNDFHGLKKLRIAIGLFDQSSALADALEVLMLNEFTVSDLCVAGSVDTMSMAGSMLQARGDVDPALIGLFTKTEPCWPHEGSLTLIGSHGGLLTALNSSISQDQKLFMHEFCDEYSLITSKFIAYINDGRLILMVGANEGGQLILASRILLKFSPYVVKTQEFLLT